MRAFGIRQIVAEIDDIYFGRTLRGERKTMTNSMCCTDGAWRELLLKRLDEITAELLQQLWREKMVGRGNDRNSPDRVQGITTSKTIVGDNHARPSRTDRLEIAESVAAIGRRK